MTTRRRRNNLVTLIGLTTLTTTLFYWGYTTLTAGSNPSKNDNNITPHKKRKPLPPSGHSKPSLTLVARSPPPQWLLSSLTAYYQLHLLLPFDPSSPSSFQFPPEVRYIPHQTAQGVIHVIRALGGVVVFDNHPPDSDDSAEDSDSEQVPPEPELEGGTARVPLAQVIDEVKSFVKGMLVVQGQGEDQGRESHSSAAVEEVRGGWPGLEERLCCI